MPNYELTLWDKITKPFWAIYRSVRDFNFEIKEFFRRIFRGYSNGEWFSFQAFHARWALPRLYHLRTHLQGFPYEFCEYDEHAWSKEDYDKAKASGEIVGGEAEAWAAVLDKMILGFTYTVSENFSRYTKLEKRLIKKMHDIYGDPWAEIPENEVKSSYHLFINPNAKEDKDAYSCHVPEDRFEESKKEYDAKGWIYEGLKTNSFYHNRTIEEKMYQIMQEGINLFAKYYRNLWD